MMLTRLTDRLTKFEKATGATADTVVIVSWVASGQGRREIRTLRRGEQRWLREVGESVEAFADRVKSQVGRSECGVTILFAELDSHTHGLQCAGNDDQTR